MRTVYAVIRYPDPGPATDWLADTLGFEVREKSIGDDGKVNHAELVLGNEMIMVGPGVPGGPGIYVAVDDPDAHHDRVKAAGATITSEPADQSYGSREYACTDPWGNNWYFGTYRP